MNTYKRSCGYGYRHRYIWYRFLISCLIAAAMVLSELPWGLTASGAEIRGSIFSYSDAGDEDVSGNDSADEDDGDDVSGDDVSGDDVSGDDVSGDDVSGDDVSGDDSGEDDEDEEEESDPITSKWLSDYNYVVNEEAGTISLNRYTGSSSKVTVSHSAVYLDKVYEVELKSADSRTGGIWYDHRSRITSLSFVGSVGVPSDMGYMLYGLDRLAFLNLSGLDMEGVTSADMMLGGVSANIIRTPVNLKVDVFLDAAYQDADGNEYASLPLSLPYSVRLTRSDGGSGSGEEEEESRSFVLGVSNNSFLHSNSAAGGFAGRENSLFDSDCLKYFSKLVDDSPVRSSILRRYFMDGQEWNGAAYGLAATMGLWCGGVEEGVSYTDDSVSCYYQMPLPAKDEKFDSAINYYNLSQIFNEAEDFAVKGGGAGTQEAYFLRGLVNKASGGELIPLAIHWEEDGESCGQVVLVTASAYVEEASCYMLTLYDPDSQDVYGESGRYSYMYIEEDFSGFSCSTDSTGVLGDKWRMMAYYDLESIMRLEGNSEEKTLDTYEDGDGTELLIIPDSGSYTVKTEEGLKITMDGDGDGLAIDGASVSQAGFFTGRKDNYLSLRLEGNDDDEEDEQEERTFLVSGDKVDISVASKGSFMSLYSTGLNRASVSEGGIYIEGTDYDFEVWMQLSGKGEDGYGRFSCIQGHGAASAYFSVSDSAIIARSQEELSDLSSRTWVDQDAREVTMNVNAYFTEIISEADSEKARRTRRTGCMPVMVGEKVDIRPYFTGISVPVRRYTSSDKNVAKVSRRGIVEGRGEGTAIIYAMSRVGRYYYNVGKYTVTVQQPYMLQTAISAEKGDELDAYDYLYAQYAPDTWVSSRPSTATVNPDTGKITMLKDGKAVITAVYGNRSRSARYRLKINTRPPITTKSVITLKVGGRKRVTLKNTSDYAVWTSSDESIATVDQYGYVRGIREGMATITATMGDVDYTCQAIVYR